MKQFQLIYSDERSFREKMHEISKYSEEHLFHGALIYISWSENCVDNLERTIQITEELFPEADCYGNETAGNICDGNFSNGIHVTCYLFEGEDTKTEIVWVEPDTEIASFEELWEYCGKKDGLKAIELIPSMDFAEKRKIDNTVPKVGDDVLIFGGSGCNVGINSVDGAAVFARNHPKTKCAMVAVLYFGEGLNISAYSIIGWKGLGRPMEITSGEGKRIKEIDGKPAYSVYEEYLNLTMEDTDTIVFPLIIKENGNEFLRTPHTIMPDKSLLFFIDIPVGEKVRIAYGDKNTILEDVYLKAEEIAPLCPEAIKVYSCAGRKMFWGEAEVGRETEILQQVAPVSGFYTGGEILCLNGKMRAMNQTLVLVTLSEDVSIRGKKPVVLSSKAPDKSLVSRLAAFTKKVSEEQEQVQEQLKRALIEADSASRSKTRFLFGMSHDIRTPLNAVIGFTDMAIKHVDDREKVLDCLIKTKKSGNMLLSLINNVLEVSRIESGASVPEEKNGDILLCFKNIESTMHELAEAKEINLTFEFGRITNRYVAGDFDRCVRVFVNVISNAIKYTRNGGIVKVRCEQTGEEKNGVGVFTYTVSDNGIGMSEEFQKHVFEQFSREKTATVSGIQGTGLGMSLCKSLVESMGGTIECRSKQNIGTTFTVVLPFKIRQETECSEEENGKKKVSEALKNCTKEGIADFKGKRLLLVEDNELNREIAVELLKEWGILVDEADDGTKAVAILREKGAEYYDFILMDIQMPIMGGYEATGIIRKMYPSAKLPIIALSANAFAEDRNASLEVGMDAHVAKPINNRDLYKVLHEFV